MKVYTAAVPISGYLLGVMTSHVINYMSL